MPKKTKQDPTGQASNRNRSTRHLVTRLNKAQRDIKALFRRIPRTSSTQVKIVNQDTLTVYDYDFNAQAQQQFDAMTGFILSGELLETQTSLMPFDWYWRNDVELPFRQGTLEEARDFNQVVAGAIIAGLLVDGLPPQPISIEQVLLSEPYRQALATVQVKNFTSMKALSERTAAQVVQTVNAGIASGLSPAAISKQITERFDVAKSSAKRIARTEINQAYNDAKIAASKLFENTTGLKTALLHISALAPTTRAQHAARHGNVYSQEQQLQWWNSGSNRINCLCTTRTVLIDKSGKVIDKELQDAIKDERAFFDEDS